MESAWNVIHAEMRPLRCLYDWNIDFPSLGIRVELFIKMKICALKNVAHVHMVFLFENLKSVFSLIFSLDLREMAP